MNKELMWELLYFFCDYIEEREMKMRNYSSSDESSSDES
jgi:hypothetical protein